MPYVHIEKAAMMGGATMHPACIDGDTPVRDPDGNLFLAKDMQPGDEFDVWSGDCCWVAATRVEMRRVRAEVLLDVPVVHSETIDTGIERRLSYYEAARVRVLHSHDPYASPVVKDDVINRPCKDCGEPENNFRHDLRAGVDRITCGKCGRTVYDDLGAL
jgi:hypothetical protein